MCGLVAKISVGQAATFPLAEWLNAIRHRGPDASSAVGWERPETLAWIGDSDFATTPYVLGHVRLSIIDVSDAADQPFLSTCGRYVIVYNGEIYNYVELREELVNSGETFRTSSDTEVLVAAWAKWGPGCLQKIEGMFAFVLFDRRANKFFVARDAFGIKPLYFSRSEGELFICSEIQPLIGHLEERVYNRRSAARFLRWGSDEGAVDTLVDGVQRLPAGICFSIDPETLEWAEECSLLDLNAIKEEDWSFDEARVALRDAFMLSVERHMRADVPISYSLSGGIDSSAIVCAAHALGRERLNTFSYVPADESISELRWIELINRRVGAISNLVTPSHADLVQRLPFVVRAQGEPVGTLSIFAQSEVHRSVARQGIKVIVSGQGADEMFAGYPHYFQVLIEKAIAKGNVGDVFRLLDAMRSSFGPGANAGEIAKMAARLLLPSRLKEGAAHGYLARRAPWLKVAALRDAGLTSLVDYGRRADPKPSLKATLRDSLRNNLASLLRYDDRNSMSYSIESRVPFLTPKLARLCLSFPDEFLVSRKGVTKHVFREAMRGIVPDEILDRRDKVPFSPDNKNWGRALLDVTADLPEHSAISQMVDEAKLKDAISLTAAGDERYDFTLMWISANMLMFDQVFRMMK